jgi:hypothetical protein
MSTQPLYGQPQAPEGVRMLSTPKPLTSAEIRQQLIYRMAEAMIRTIFVGADPLPQELLNEVVESMDKHIVGCNLNGKAYSDYRAKWTLDVEYNNFGMKIGDHFEGSVQHGELGAETETIKLEVEIDPIPPNLARVEAEQEVPVSSMGRGRVNVKYPRPEKSSAKVKRG